jgi:integrase
VDALAALQRGELTANRGVTVREAIDVFLAGVEDGSICNRSGQVFKPSAVRGLRRELRGRVSTAFGAARLGELTLPDVQRFADKVAAEGVAPQTIKNVVHSIGSVYAWALPRGLAKINPTTGVRLPTGGKVRDRIATPAEARLLIGALDPSDQAALGLALFAGLRLGEIVALDWDHVDLAARTLRVERAWDGPAQEYVSPKSKAGRRTVPIMDRLAGLLADHRVLQNHPASGLLFPGRDGQPVRPTNLTGRMARRWKAAGIPPIGMHEARHTAASVFIAAGLNAKTISVYLGHADIGTTFNRYGHLMPGNEHEARGLLDAYMEAHDE